LVAFSVGMSNSAALAGCRFYVDFHRAFEYKGTALPISSVGVLQ
jgi:hypothetical protein